MSDSLVADVGGTSTDVGVLTNGFPRESAQGVEIGGVRTNFRMPDLVTIALGGGSVVSAGPAGVRIGPRSVGYLLPQEALVFGGTTPTLTDSAVAAGRAALGSAGRGGATGIGRHKRMLTEALARADVMLAEAIDRVKTSQEDRPLIAVGGGSILVPDRIPGVSEIVRPEHFDAANAVGAAIASVSGQVDRIFHLGADGRQAVLDEASDEARERAVAAGANPDTVQPGHHLQARPGTGLDRKHIGGIHEAPSRTARRRRRCRRAGPDPGRVWRVHRPGQHAAAGQQGVHLRHHVPGHGGRLGPGHRVLQRHHRDERDVRDAHPLQQRHQYRRAAARHQLDVGGRRQDLDLPPAARRALPHRPSADGAGGQGRD
jgi:hypothetical protein